jgi:hypothetical protein
LGKGRGGGRGRIFGDVVDGFGEQGETLIQFRVGDRKRRHQLDDLVGRAGGFHDQAAVEGVGRHLGGQPGLIEFEAVRHAAPARPCVRHGVGERGERRVDAAAVGDASPRQFAVAPVSAQCRCSGDQRRVDAAECPRVFARFPDIQFGPDQREREREPVAADGLGHAHDVRLDPGHLEAEERPGPAAAHLHVVDDEQDAVPLAPLRQATKPGGRRDVDPAFALDALHDHRRRKVETAASVVEHPIEPREVGDVATREALVRQRRGIRERHPGAAAVEGVPRDGQCRQRHAMEAVREIRDLRAARHLPGELQRRLDGDRARRTRELHFVVQSPWPQDQLIERGQELGLGDREHVERMDNPVRGQVVEERFLEYRVVVPVVERARAGEEI